MKMKSEKMSKRTIGAIYSIKQNEGATNYEKLAKFMSKYTDTPIEHYNSNNLTTIMSQVFAELFDYVKYPSGLFFEYFRWKQAPWNYSDFDAMCAALSTVQVREKDGFTDEYKYINGFWEFDVSDYN